MVGICFGHQIIAKALGGVVSKSDKGWGVGIHTYELNTSPFDGAQLWSAEVGGVASRPGT